MTSLNDGAAEEQELIRKMKLVEALVMGGATDGEREAAGEAMKRLHERLTLYKGLRHVEYTFKMENEWHRALFVALLRRYDIKPYRYARQRRTTVVAKVSERFAVETLWPQFQKMTAMLDKHMSKITDRIITEAIHADRSEAEVVAEPHRLAEPTPEGH